MRHPERPPQIDRKRLLNYVELDRAQRRRLPDAGIVDQEIEADIRQFLKHVFHLSGRTDIGPNQPRWPFNERCHLFSRTAVPMIMQYDIGSPARQFQADRAADAARTSGDEGRLAFERCGHLRGEESRLSVLTLRRSSPSSSIGVSRMNGLLRNLGCRRIRRKPASPM